MNNEFLTLSNGTVLLLDNEVSSAETGSTASTGTDGTASETPQQAGGAFQLISMLVVWGIVIVALYFIMIRPQRKKSKEEKKMRENLQVGDEVITIGGIYGRVISLKEDTMVIESKSDHSKITVARWALQTDLTVHEDTEN